jgi:hypothetical protein
MKKEKILNFLKLQEQVKELNGTISEELYQIIHTIKNGDRLCLGD